ncbi:MAG: NHL repeat-containing protein [Legionella sp.]|uniref:NHL repeat-containing protein n=1 Tax=Legionella sp. TaxID=459 RepID=UPI0039E3CA2C
MMNQKIKILVVGLFLLSSWVYANPGLLFKIAESGSPAVVDVILCLNGKRPLSCQNYHVFTKNLTIGTTVNHYYPQAGIKILTPGYQPTGCVPIANGYCLFATSNTLLATIYLNSSSQKNQTITFTSVPPSIVTVGLTYHVAATASSGLPVTITVNSSSTSVCSISGNTVTFNAVGICILDANQAGNAQYDAALQVQQSIDVPLMLFMADNDNNAVKAMTADCTSSSCVTVLGGGFSSVQGIAVDAFGHVYVTDTINNTVNVMSVDCTSSSCVTVLGGGFSSPSGIAVDASGDIYVADTGHGEVKVMPAGCTSSSCVTTLGGGFTLPVGVALDAPGNVYVADVSYNAIKIIPVGCTSSSCVTSMGGGFSQPWGIAVDASGHVYVTILANGAAVTVMPAGCTSSSCVSTLGGGFNFPEGVAVNAAGDVYVADSGNSAVKVMPAGCTSSSCVTTLGGGFFGVTGVAVNPAAVITFRR